MKLYMMVTNDEYELPLAVAASAQELARLVGEKTPNNILSTISKAEKLGSRSKYVRVTIEED